MSEILTEAQVAALRKKLCDSHESLRGYFDALLQGATAQKVATLMNEADRTKEAFPADSVWDQHAVQCGNCEVWLITKNSPLKANGFPSNGLSDTGESEDEALCGMCAGAEMYRLMDEADKARVEISWLKEVHAENKGDITMLHNEADIIRVEIERLEGDIELALRRIFNLEDITRIAELEKHLESVLTALGCQLAGVDGALKVIDAKNTAIAELEKERDAAIAERDAAERWESGFRNVVYALHGSRFLFDIPLIVEDVKSAITERDGLRMAIEKAPHAEYCNYDLCRKCDGHLMTGPSQRYCQCPKPRPQPCDCWKSRALAAVPAPVAQQGKSHAHQWLKNGDYREDSMFGISCPVWACGSCKITCSATDKPSENL